MGDDAGRGERPLTAGGRKRRHQRSSNYRGIWIGGIAFAQLEPATTFQNSRGLDPTANSSGFVQDK